MSNNGDETIECPNPECEESTEVDYKFCAHCGYQLEDQQEKEMEEENEEMEGSKETEDSAETESENSDTQCEADSEETEESDTDDSEKSEEIPPKPSSYSELKELEYGELQEHAKNVGVKANLKTGVLQEKLADEFDLEKPESEESEVESGEMEVEPDETKDKSDSDSDDDSAGDDITPPPEKPSNGSNGGNNGFGGNGSGGNGGSGSGDGFNWPLIGLLICFFLLIPLALFVGWSFHSQSQDSEESKQVAQSTDEHTESEDERKLEQKVWSSIPDDVKPLVREYESLIGEPAPKAYKRCEKLTETSKALGTCADFVDIIDGIDNSELVKDRLGDIRYRHQLDKDS